MILWAGNKLSTNVFHRSRIGLQQQRSAIFLRFLNRQLGSISDSWYTATIIPPAEPGVGRFG